MRGKALPGFAGYFHRQAAMHPSVCALRRIHLPLQGRLWGTAAYKASPARGGGIASAMAEGCGALPCEYPSGLVQGPPAGVNARPTMQGKRVAEPGTAGGVPAPLCVGADDFIGPPSGLADGWRWRAGTCLWPQCRAGVLARRCTPTGPPTKKHRGAAKRRPGAKSGKKKRGVNRWCNTAPGRATACGTGRPRRPPARRGCRSGRWRPGQTRRSRRRTCSWTAGG